MQKKFTIIIPVYNVEKYLKKCLDSVVHQTYSNFEVIIVCDKCDDDSEKIVDEYANKYNWIKIHDENTGLAKARNIGVKHATGDYLIFLDSDDYLKLNLLDTLNDNLKEDLDVVRFQAQERIDNQIIRHDEQGFNSMKGTDAFKNIIKYHYIENAWLYCYKTSFWKQNNFEFMEGCIAEDYGLTPLVIAKAEKVKSISYVGYNYVQRKNSLMSNSDYKKKLKKMEDMLRQSINLKKKLEKINNYEYFVYFINNSLICYSTKLKYKDYKKYNKILKQNNCFAHLKKINFNNIVIKLNSYIFYNYITR